MDQLKAKLEDLQTKYHQFSLENEQLKSDNQRLVAEVEAAKSSNEDANQVRSLRQGISAVVVGIVVVAAAAA